MSAVLSVHLADVGVRRAARIRHNTPRPGDVPGLRYAETTLTAPLTASLVPRPQPGRVGLIAAWEDDTALDGFLGTHPVAEQLGAGWHVRLQPLRAVGGWSKLADLPTGEQPVDEDEPVAVLTLGRLRIPRAAGFLKASARATRQAVGDPALLAATGLARPPALVATFSLSRNAAAMRAYAGGTSGSGHVSAVREHAKRPFHHESLFVRFRPYDSDGSWGGHNPLAELG